MSKFNRAFSDEDLQRECWEPDKWIVSDEVKRAYAHIDDLERKLNHIQIAANIFEDRCKKLEALKARADNALLRYATLKSDCYEDGKAAREYLKAAKELDDV
jgi:hypothetical protein